MKLHFGLLAGIVFLFARCTPKNEPQPVVIDTIFQKYVDVFLNEGQKRGQNIKLDSEGITLQFGDTQINGKLYGGVTYLETHTININKEYWNTATEEYREYIIFHELGHLLLKREHLSTLWSNGESKSLMYSYDNAFALGFPIFQGFRKKYYLDELFEPLKQDEPEWCKVSAVDTPILAQTNAPKIQENFDKSFSLPTLANLTDLKLSFASGAMLIENSSGVQYAIGIKNFLPTSNLSDLKNYEIRYRFRNKGESQGGWDWNQNGMTANAYYFRITPKNESLVGSSLGYFYNFYVKSEYSEWNDVVLKYDSPNANVWLNGKLLLKTDVVSTAPNDNWRFATIVPANGSVEMDQIMIY